MNPQFISYLVNKLQTGSLKSIHLNALPGRLSTRLDISQLNILSGVDANKNLPRNEEQKELPITISQNFLFNNLLKKPKFQYKINFDEIEKTKIEEDTQNQLNLISRKLNSIVNQNEDGYLEHGVKTFSFGYPLLIHRSRQESNKIIKAPVIIWNLDVKRSNQKQSEWIIERNEDSPIYINEVLISYVANDEGVVIEDLPNNFLEDNLIDKEEILQIINEILSKLSSNNAVQDIDLEECINKENIDKNTNSNPWILWTGIFGLFKTQKQSIIRDTAKLLDLGEEFNLEETYDDSAERFQNSSVPTDPSQEEIVNTLNKGEYKLIQGPPGTGKSQSLTAIITNTLENEKKILVVCEKKTALDVIYNNLRKLDLHNFVAIIDDVNRDRKVIIDKVRHISENKEEENRPFNEQVYDTKLRQYTGMVNSFNHKHHKLLEPIFRGYNTQEIISEYLSLKKSLKIDERLLLEVDFEFTDDEYNKLITIIEQAVDLYDEIPLETHVYDILSENNFKREYSIQTENQINYQISNEIEFLKSVKTDYYHLQNAEIETFYDIQNADYKQNNIDEYTANIKALILYWQNIAKETERLKLHFDSINFVNESAFSSKIKALHTLYDNLSNHIGNLVKIDEMLYLLAINIDKLPSEANKNYIDFKKSSKFKAIFSSKHRAIRRFHEFYAETCIKINLVISDNQMNNTNANLQKIMKDIVPISTELENLIAKLNLCLDNKKWFQEYHNWRYLFDNLYSVAYHSIDILKKNCLHKDWKDAFRLSYINLFIETKAGKQDDYNLNSKNIDRIGALREDLKYLHRYKILKIWKEQAKESIKKYNRESNIKWLFNYRKNSKYAKKNTLRAILHEEFELFTDIFPVILVNPVVCSSIFPLRKDLFEVILFDEASQLRLEDTYSALMRGKIKVISGDKHQMPPTSYFSTDIAPESSDNEQEESYAPNYEKSHPLFLAESESLLDFGNNLNPEKINTSFLDYHYRSKHPMLIDFSNAAFYGGRLIPMPAKSDYKPIRFFYVNGEYQKNNTNIDEAKQIIHFLKAEYPVNKSGRYPSLGIATFNMQQRNLIKDMINDECVVDEAFRLKMNKIAETEDWFVKNLENIQGDERDIIMISTTFGRNSEGKFRQSFGQINTTKGYKLLNVIITRAKKQLYVFSSIPDKYISNYQDDIEMKGNKGKAVLYAYLDYCRAIENNNEAHRQGILKTLSDACEEEKNSANLSGTISAFKDEVYGYLSQHIRPENLKMNYQLGGYIIDFVITNDSGKAFIAIDCDGAERHKGRQAFAHDLHRKKIFEQQGLKVYRIWAKAWHPNPDKEIGRLLRFMGR